MRGREGKNILIRFEDSVCLSETDQLALSLGGAAVTV